MKITKHKTDKPGVWALRVDGRPLPYTIEKGDKPEYRMPQEWLVCRGEFVLCRSYQRATGLMAFLNEFLAEVSPTPCEPIGG